MKFILDQGSIIRRYGITLLLTVCDLLNKNKPVLTATRYKNLYNIDSKTIMPDKYTVNIADIDTKDIHLWHKCLGHMRTESMKSMIMNGIINGIPHLKNKELFCEDCTVNKMVKQPFQETT